jgi:hypothetical protein
MVCQDVSSCILRCLPASSQCRCACVSKGTACARDAGCTAIEVRAAQNPQIAVPLLGQLADSPIGYTYSLVLRIIPLVGGCISPRALIQLQFLLQSLRLCKLVQRAFSLCNVMSVTACRRTSNPAPHRVHTHTHTPNTSLSLPVVRPQPCLQVAARTTTALTLSVRPHPRRPHHHPRWTRPRTMPRVLRHAPPPPWPSPWGQGLVASCA